MVSFCLDFVPLFPVRVGPGTAQIAQTHPEICDLPPEKPFRIAGRQTLDGRQVKVEKRETPSASK